MMVVSTFFSALTIEEEDVLDKYCNSPVCNVGKSNVERGLKY